MAVLLLLMPRPAFGDVDLGLVPVATPVAVGDFVDVQLRATATLAAGEDFGVIDALFTWDDAVLLFVGVEDTGDCCEWFISNFLPDPDNVNISLTDGDALYSAVAEIGTGVTAPPAPGFIITTFRFQALVPSTGTTVSLLPSFGAFAETRVLGTSPGQVVTGDISVSATVMITAPDADFRRGDSNNDGVENIADPVATLSYLFAGAAVPECLDTADANDDGSVNVADAVYTLAYLFAGGALLPSPWPACGPDPTPDALGCVLYDCP